jgi:hypothetical protein
MAAASPPPTVAQVSAQYLGHTSSSAGACRCAHCASAAFRIVCWLLNAHLALLLHPCLLQRPTAARPAATAPPVATALPTRTRRRPPAVTALPAAATVSSSAALSSCLLLCSPSQIWLPLNLLLPLPFSPWAGHSHSHRHCGTRPPPPLHLQAPLPPPPPSGRSCTMTRAGLTTTTLPQGSPRCAGGLHLSRGFHLCCCHQPQLQLARQAVCACWQAPAVQQPGIMLACLVPAF